MPIDRDYPPDCTHLSKWRPATGQVRSAPGPSASYFELMYSFFAGEFPKELGKLVNLKSFDASWQDQVRGNPVAEYTALLQV